MLQKIGINLRASLLSVFVGGLLVFLTGGCQAGGVQNANDSAVKAELGKAAPAFELTDSKGNKQSLDDFKGKFVVLEWVNYECPFVRKHYDSGNMQRLQQKYGNKGVIWLSINSSADGKQGNYVSERINQLMKEKKASPSSYLLDPNGTVGRMYGAKTTPHMFIIDPKGILIYAGAIDDKPGFDASEIAQAKNYVELVLDEAMKGKQASISKTPSYGCSVKYQ